MIYLAISLGTVIGILVALLTRKESSPTRLKLSVGIGAATAAVIFVGLWLDNRVPSATPEQAAVTWNHKAQINNYLHANLNDPESLEIAGWGELQQDGTEEYWIRLKYRAKNGFGVMTLADDVFTMDSKGRIYNIESTDAFTTRKLMQRINDSTQPSDEQPEAQTQ